MIKLCSIITLLLLNSAESGLRFEIETVADTIYADTVPKSSYSQYKDRLTDASPKNSVAGYYYLTYYSGIECTNSPVFYEAYPIGICLPLKDSSDKSNQNEFVILSCISSGEINWVV